MTISSCTLYLRDQTPVSAENSSDRKAKTNQVSDISSNSASYNSSGIGAGDIVEIVVYGEKELSGTYQITPEGILIFPFIGEIKVLTLTIFSLSSRITEELKKGYIKDPQVTVMIKEYRSKRVFVLGQVNNAGAFFIKDEMSVVEAVALAGGFTRIADTKNVVITRYESDNSEKKFSIDIDAIIRGEKKRFLLKPGDAVYVPERFF